MLSMATLLGLWSGAANAGVGEFGLDAPRLTTQTKTVKSAPVEPAPTTAGVGEYGLD